MSNYFVALEAAWPVRDVDSVDDAIGVAVSEAGKRLNEKGKEFVDLHVGFKSCPTCGEEFDAALVAADTAMVSLVLEIEVFDVDGETHAGRVAKSEVGGALRDVPLSIVDIVETEATDDADEVDGRRGNGE